MLRWHWLVNSTNNKRSGHSELGIYLPHPDFSKKLGIKHLQLYLPYPGSNQFGNDIKTAFRPNKLVESSDSLYSKNNGGCNGV